MARSTQQTRFRLANQILDVIRDARMEPGHHLREQPLADLIGVSRTPIRSALDLLAERGIVETRKNQGFFLSKAFDTLHRIEIEVPSTVDEELYSRLVRDRLAQHRQPERQQQRQQEQSRQGEHGAEVAAMQFGIDDGAHGLRVGSWRRALMITQMTSSVTANPHHWMA